MSNPGKRRKGDQAERLLRRKFNTKLPPLAYTPARLACDIAVSIADMRSLISLGIDVVSLANDGEPDAEWFARGYAKGANVFASPDSDIGRLCALNDVRWIRLGPRATSSERRRTIVGKLLLWGMHRVAPLERTA